ncbi:MAG: CDP-alcohol phosphatidyltransferase family protein [Pseudomonadota bacterium]
MTREQIPNLLSSLRIALIIPVVWALLADSPLVALILFAIAGLTDSLDGWLARREHWETPIGGVLDGVADKLLLFCVYICLWWLDSVPTWLIAVLFGRDLVIGIGYLLYRTRLGGFKAAPTPTGKVHIFLQICLVILIMAESSVFPMMLPGLIDGFMKMLLITATISLIGYIRQWYQDTCTAYYRKLYEAEQRDKKVWSK